MNGSPWCPKPLTPSTADDSIVPYLIVPQVSVCGKQHNIIQHN